MARGGPRLGGTRCHHDVEVARPARELPHREGAAVRERGMRTARQHGGSDSLQHHDRRTTDCVDATVNAMQTADGPRGA